MKIYSTLLLSFISLLLTTTVNAQITITANSSNPSCYSSTNGMINVDATGGTFPYYYLWNTGQTQDSIWGLSAGVYQVTVTDGFSTTATESYTLTEPSDVTTTSTITTTDCGQTNGAISLTTTGGASPYLYNWANGQTTNNATGLAGGNYVVTITDATYCTNSDTITVSTSNGLLVSLSASNNGCPGGSDGVIVSSVSGGANPYTYTWSNGETVANPGQLYSGTYVLTVTDNSGCEFSASIFVPDAEAIQIGVNPVQTGCDSSGVIITSPTSGTPPYSFLWSNGETTSEITGLSAGIYALTVTDDIGCIVQDPAISVTSGCPYGFICGRLYNDLNGNGVEDLNEPPYAGVKLRAYWSSHYTTSNSNGDFKFQVPINSGYQIKPVYDSSWTNCGFDYISFDTIYAGVSDLSPVVDSLVMGISHPNLQCGKIGGFVFDDTNGNGIQDGTESGNPGIQVDLGNGIYSYSNANGTYFKDVPYGNYTIQLSPFSNYSYFCNSPNPVVSQTFPSNNGNYSATIDNSQPTSLNNDFGINTNVFPEAGIYTLIITNGTVPSQNFQAWSDFKISDAFSDTCILTIYHDPYVSLVNSSIPVTSTTDTSAIWVFTNLGQYYMHCMQMTWHLDANTPDGYVLNWYETIGCLGAPDPCPNNNTITRTAVANAPNRATDDFNGMFSYTNAGEMPLNISHADSTFSYEIHYQNTSEDTAYNMLIFDTLPPELNVATLSKAFGSHPHKYSVISDNVILWEFEGINLPDTGTSYIDSYGFVQYNIRMHPNLPMGTIINNSATVIFNQEPATKTNTVTHAIVNTTGVENQNMHTNSVSVYPNPTNGNIVVEIMNFELNNKAQVTITNAVGQVIYQSNISNSTFNISLNEPNGIYFMNVQLNNKVISKRIAISK